MKSIETLEEKGSGHDSDSDDHEHEIEQNKTENNNPEVQRVSIVGHYHVCFTSFKFLL